MRRLWQSIKRLTPATDIGGDLAEIGIVYSTLGQNEKALSIMRKRWQSHKEIGDRNGVGEVLGRHWDAVLPTWAGMKRRSEYYQESLAIDKEVGDQEGVAINLTSIGSVHSGLGQYEKAYETLGESLKIGTEIGAPTFCGERCVSLVKQVQSWEKTSKPSLIMERLSTLSRPCGRGFQKKRPKSFS